MILKIEETYITNPCVEINLNATIELKPMPNPTPKDLTSPDFLAIWDIIKDWDIASHKNYNGFTSGNGSHVMLILEKLRPVLRDEKIDSIIS